MPLDRTPFLCCTSRRDWYQFTTLRLQLKMRSWLIRKRICKRVHTPSVCLVTIRKWPFCNSDRSPKAHGEKLEEITKRVEAK